MLLIILIAVAHQFNSVEAYARTHIKNVSLRAPFSGSFSFFPFDSTIIICGVSEKRVTSSLKLAPYSSCCANIFVLTCGYGQLIGFWSSHFRIFYEMTSCVSSLFASNSPRHLCHTVVASGWLSKHTFIMECNAELLSIRFVSCIYLIYLKCDLRIASIPCIHVVVHFSTRIPITPSRNLRASPTIQCYTIYLPTRYIS